MLTAHVIQEIERHFPLFYQEKWDNSGLQTGSLRTEASGALICVDVTPETVEEAKKLGCNLIISHHPLIFHGLKRLTGDHPVERSVEEAIKAGISIYSCHTPADNVLCGGVSGEMAERLGFQPIRSLSPMQDFMSRIDLDFMPGLELETAIEEVADEIKGPVKASINKEGGKMSITLPTAWVNKVLERIRDVTDSIPAADIVPLSNISTKLGPGAYAINDEGISSLRLIEKVKESFGSPRVRVTDRPEEEVKIRRVALCGGSGAEFIPEAISAGAQAYITSDIKYHDFLDYGKRILLIDIGHFEAEQITKEIFYNIIKEKFPTFALYKSGIERNCVEYV